MLVERLNEGLDRAIDVADDHTVLRTDLGKLSRLDHQVCIRNEGDRLAVAERFVDEVDGQARFTQSLGAIAPQDNRAVVHHRGSVRRRAVDLLRVAVRIGDDASVGGDELDNTASG
jgi:hypothetical protein